MTNNAPDYEENLVFPPQEIKSQHELTEQVRQSDVLIKAIEKCKELEFKLVNVVKILSRECPKYQDWLETNYKEYLENWDDNKQ